jgi:molecular chaperone GrpE (heat shock protein)
MLRRFRKSLHKFVVNYQETNRKLIEQDAAIALLTQQLERTNAALVKSEAERANATKGTGLEAVRTYLISTMERYGVAADGEPTSLELAEYIGAMLTSRGDRIEELGRQSQGLADELVEQSARANEYFRELGPAKQRARDFATWYFAVSAAANAAKSAGDSSTASGRNELDKLLRVCLLSLTPTGGL